MALQKLAHRDSEKRQKRNLVRVNSQQNESTDSQTGEDDNYNTVEKDAMEKEESTELVEQDSDSSLKTYCSWKFLLGLITMFCSIGIHTYLL